MLEKSAADHVQTLISSRLRLIKTSFIFGPMMMYCRMGVDTGRVDDPRAQTSSTRGVERRNMLTQWCGGGCGERGGHGWLTARTR